jgi:pyruvate ferredoxin oxidoreductase alpha subunit
MVGTIVSPDFYTEARYINHQDFEKALTVIKETDEIYFHLTGRRSGALLSVTGNRNGRTGILLMGSVFGTLTDALSSHEGKEDIRLLKLRSFRPFPQKELQEAVHGLRTLIVLDRSISPGGGAGIVGMEVRSALFGQKDAPRIINAVVGLGGRDLPMSLLRQLVDLSKKTDAPEFLFADLEPSRITRELSPLNRTNTSEER